MKQPDWKRREFLGVLGITVLAGTEVSDSMQGAPQATDRKRVIRTILKDLDPGAISGTTLMHEHLGLGRTRNPQSGAPPDGPTEDSAWMEIELKAAHGAGVGCMVSTQAGMPGPAVVSYLTQLSEHCGLHLINAASYYTEPSYPKDLASQSDDEIADGIVKAAKATRMGALGEFGVINGEAEMSPIEKKVFRAAGKASVRTGLPIFTHNNYSTGPMVPADMALRQLDELEAVGVPPERVALGHLCCHDDPKVEIAKRVAKRGAFVAFDRVTRQQQWVSDEHRIVMIKAFLEAGYINNLVISSDYIGRVNVAAGEISRYPGPIHARDGGPGYARPVKLFVPLMKQAGIKDKAIRQIMQDNPKRFLAFVPKEA